ncbi:MAG: hypothetical protein AB7S26_33290 [Sandaracinaceae bacterium]
MPPTPLLDALRARGLITPDEEHILLSPEVAALSPRDQLEHLRSNRRVGRAVTLFAGGLRVTLIAGALAAHVGMTLDGTLSFGWWAPLGWLGLVAVLSWLALGLIRRVRALSAVLPSAEVLGLEERAG